MITLIDNYDSFTYNLYHYLSSREKVVIIKNDQVSKNFNTIIKSKGIVISPGPSTPFNSGECLSLVHKIYSFMPILGVCLGHQILSLAFNAETVRMEKGHRGGNHPVKNLITGKSEITSQNHGFAIDPESNNGSVEISLTVIVADRVNGAITTSLLSSNPVKARKKASKGSSSRLVLVVVVPCVLLAVIKPNSAFKTSMV